LRSVNCPSVIAECGFMTNFSEAKLMVDPDFQRLCGDGGCRGVCKNLDVEYVPDIDYTEMPLIRQGTRGNVVKFLQCYLNLYGGELTIDGVFGNDTTAAVKEFQKNNGLSADGIVGRNTWRTLLMQDTTLPLLRQGSRGVYVRYLQQKLLSKLYPVGTVDGIFGANTTAAVKQFQTENGLTADGIVGPLTWAKVTPIGGGRPITT
ncbi:MAG: peptidoglycan-binding protein, partial [Clostridia bacterium]|nr:peptidoglycan-binding protein [Clostridia bacterium]